MPNCNRWSFANLKMNYKRFALFSGIMLCLAFVIPNASAAEFVLDEFSDGPAAVSTFQFCEYSDNSAPLVLGEIRGIFVCTDYGTTTTAETDTTLEQFVFSYQFRASSGLNYDREGNLLGGEDVTDGGANNAFRLDFVKSDTSNIVTVAAGDVDGKFGLFRFTKGASGPTSEVIPFSMIKDPITMEVPDFSKLENVNILFDGRGTHGVNNELILGKVVAVSSEPMEECPPGTTGIYPDCTPIGGLPIGGELIPIDTTSLLLAGAHLTASWLIPVIVTGAGIVFVLVRRK